jgi:hypothetical protein
MFESMGKIKRSAKTREVLVIKFYHHNKSNSPKVKTHVDKLLKEVKDTSLIQYIYSIDIASQEEEVQVQEEEEELQEEEERKDREALPPPPAEHSLITWIKKHTPRVHQLKQPLTNEQAEKLIADLEIDKGPRGEMLKDILTNMENYSPLLSKSVSANLTIRKWWKMELERNGEIQKPTTVAFIPNTTPHYK